MPEFMFWKKTALHSRIATKQNRDIVSLGFKTCTILKFKFPNALSGMG